MALAVENSSEGGLIGPFVLRQLCENSASSESHALEVGAQRTVVAIASQPGCFEQQPHNHIRIIRAGIILGTATPAARPRFVAAAGGRSFRLSGQVWETSVSLGPELNFCGSGHGASFSIPNPYISHCGLLAKMKMPCLLHSVMS